MKSLARRLALLSALALSALLATLGNAAAQQECDDDGDCAENQHCAFEAVSCRGEVPSQPGEEAPEPVCEFEGPGVCVTDCVDDSDCEEGFRCEKLIAISQGACPPGGECPDEEIIEPETGTCEPAPIECESDADCPEPLVCELGDCPPSVEGDASEDCDAASIGECVFELTECESDADCDADYECAPVGRGEESCRASASAPMPDCAPGEECPMPEPESYEEVCEGGEEQWTCFPKEVGCDTDDDCDDGWSCFDFSDIPELEAEDGYVGPPWWSTGEPGVAVACMPEGLIALFEGRADAEGRGSYENGDSATASLGAESAHDNGDDREAGAPSGPAKADTDGEGADDEASADEESADEEEEAEDDSGGCSIVVGRDASSSWVLLLGAAVVLGLARRRRRR